MRQGFLRVLTVGLLFAAGCGDGAESFPPENDAGAEQDGGIDAGPLPSFDVPSTPQDTGTVTPTDTGSVTPRDTGNRTDTGSTTPTDRGGGGGGVCPPSCQTNADCNPCRDPSDPPGSEYCCMSGLCLYMNGMCSSNPTGDGGTGPGPGGDGGADDGGLGGDAGGGFDDASFPGADGGDGGP
jgi:hypothetical protein